MLVDRAELAAALPSYELKGQLGAGAFGLVVAGRHRQLGRDVAIKVLASHGGAQADFQAEAQLLASMDHPHIVRVYDYVERGGLCLIIMELLAGGSLTSRVTGMPPEAACAVGVAIAEGLFYAHSHGVLHRDVKPDNVLFDAAGVLKISDFGIAKAFAGSAVLPSMVAGTPPYMAPEQISGGGLGPATDVYAVGVLLYQMLTGALPYSPALSLTERHRLQLAGPPPAPAGVPRVLGAVVTRALAADPGSRQGSARELARELAAAADHGFGRGWILRSGVVLVLDDEARGALGLAGVATQTQARPTVAPSAPTPVPALSPVIPKEPPPQQAPAAPPGPVPDPASAHTQASVLPPPTGGPGARGGANAIRRSPANRRVLIGAGVVLLAGVAVLAAFLTGQPDRPQATGSTRPTPQPAAAPEKIGCASGSITLIGSAFGPIAGRAASIYMSKCKHAIINLEYGHGISSAYGVAQVEKAVSTHSPQAGSTIAMYDGVTTLAAGLTPDPVGVLIYSVVAHTGAAPGSNISITELKQLYTRPGGVPGKVGVGLQGGSGTRQALLRLWGEQEPGPVIPGNCPAPSEHAVSYPRCTENSYAAALGFVDATPNAIGYLAIDAEVDGHPTGYPYTSTIYTNTSVISIDGAAPTPENVHDGSYAFVAVEHLYLPPHPTALAQSFLAYLPRYLASYQSPDYTTCSNAPQNLAAEC
jgi:ABC-type phosphate transport system substrate-binding protein